MLRTRNMKVMNNTDKLLINFTAWLIREKFMILRFNWLYRYCYFSPANSKMERKKECGCIKALLLRKITGNQSTSRGSVLLMNNWNLGSNLKLCFKT